MHWIVQMSVILNSTAVEQISYESILLFLKKVCKDVFDIRQFKYMMYKREDHKVTYPTVPNDNCLEQITFIEKPK